MLPLLIPHQLFVQPRAQLLRRVFAEADDRLQRSVRLDRHQLLLRDGAGQRGGLEASEGVAPLEHLAEVGELLHRADLLEELVHRHKRVRRVRDVPCAAKRRHENAIPNFELQYYGSSVPP